VTIVSTSSDPSAPERTGRRLSEYSHGAGCACKLAPGALAGVVARLSPPGHPDLLVGALTGDDAAVWRLDDDRALVLTTDFITPVVDDPRAWGRIAATNAASDVYAMGGRPLLALNVVAWNVAELSDDLLVEVLGGALEAAVAGSFVIAGGHTVDDPEPKFGLAVVGEVDPARMLTNTGLRDGDRLVLTKALGVGMITTGVKRGVAPQSVVDGAVESMSRLNDEAARVAVACGATGATDVTGFGLLNHLGRMALESGVDVTIDLDAVPILPGARELAGDGVVSGGTRRNLEHIGPRLDAGGRSEIDVLLMADAQTSGGLVFGVGPAQADAAVDELRRSGHPAAVIGEVAAGTGRGLVALR
jgi:selenide, water dikinase